MFRKPITLARLAGELPLFPWGIHDEIE